VRLVFKVSIVVIYSLEIYFQSMKKVAIDCRKSMVWPVKQIIKLTWP